MKHPYLTAMTGLTTFLAGTALAVPSAAQQRGAAPTAAAKPTAQPATRTELARAADSTFQKIDTNSDRSLSKAEIDAAEARRSQQVAQNVQSRIAQEFAKLDTDKNGQLSLAEFRAAAPQVRVNPNASTQVLQRLDVNKDGKISPDEYRAPMLASFDRIDLNKDGTISSDERAKAAAARTASNK